MNRLLEVDAQAPDALGMGTPPWNTLLVLFHLAPVVAELLGRRHLKQRLRAELLRHVVPKADS